MLTGGNFLNKPSLSCRFRDVIVRATFISASKVYCVTPSWQLLRNLTIAMEETKIYTCRWERLDRTTDYRVCDLPEGTDLAGLKAALEMPLFEDVQVEVSVDSEVFVPVSHPYRFYESPRVYYVEPFISAREGGVPVTIHGQNFQKGATDILCKFGEPSEATENVFSVATFVDQRTLICTSPPFNTSRVVALEVLRFAAFPRAFGQSVAPRSGKCSMARLLSLCAFEYRAACRSVSTGHRATTPKTIRRSSSRRRGWSKP